MASKVEVIPFGEFVRGEWKPKARCEKVVEHLKRNKTIYRAAALTTVVFLAGTDLAFAAETVIDSKATVIYKKLLSIGKWVIIFKGGFDTIHSAIQGDMIAARKNVMSYMLVYIILIGLPWCLSQIDLIFSDLA